MLCSAPQPSKATWFSTRPHWPAAPGAGKASPAAPHHLRNSGDQTSHPFTRDCSGQSLPHILLHQHRGAASVCPKQLQLPLCQRCQEWGQPRAQLPAGGLCSWRCLWHRNQCQNSPCPCWGSLCPEWGYRRCVLLVGRGTTRVGGFLPVLGTFSSLPLIFSPRSFI